MTATLPMESCLDRLAIAMAAGSTVIISAAPGAGKTTLAPPVIAAAATGRTLLLEPRRIAARAAASRIADLYHVRLGGEVGYVVRDDSRISSSSRLVVMTPGVLLRKLQDDPLLEDVGAVIFDEFHERGTESDLAFALIGDLRKELRSDLKLVVMSATADLAALRRLLPEAVCLEVPGKLFPVTVEYQSDPVPPDRLVHEAGKAILRGCRETQSGDLLVFLPGQREIEDLGAALTGKLPTEFDLMRLHGSLPLEQQNLVLAPAPPGRRKVILSTNVAESSLTIDGVTMVIDSGREKRLHYAPAAGLSFLEPRRISQASARQRAGRAGRTAPGKAIRLWTRAEELGFKNFSPPEILECDLLPPALAIAEWGTPCDQLNWIDPPPRGTYADAVKQLTALGALDPSGHLTPRGRQMAALPVHPRLGAMLLKAAELKQIPLAAEIAALLEERDISGLSGSGADLRERIVQLRRFPRRYPAIDKIRQRLLALFPDGRRQPAGDPEGCGLLLACAYPDWIAQNRTYHGTDFRLAGGGSAGLLPDDDLRRHEFLAVGRLDGQRGGSGIIRLAAPLDPAEIRTAWPDRLTQVVTVEFDQDSEKAAARRELRLGALILESSAVPPPAGRLPEAVLNAAIKRKLSLPPESAAAANRLLERVRFAARTEPGEFPDWSEEKWPETLPQILLPFATELRSFDGLARLDWHAALKAALGREKLAQLDQFYPADFISPPGIRHPVRYAGEIPAVSLRVQELFGLDRQPTLGKRQLPLRLELLSPACRPVQVTTDLPGFWRGSWKLVRKEMRGRYPKHDWPETPWLARPGCGPKTH